MTDVIETLAAAIEEGAAWRWWTQSGDRVQLEFTSPHLARRSSNLAVPVPIGVVALTFERVHCLAFLTRTAAEDVPTDWPTQMANDTLDFEAVPTSLSFEQFAFNDEEGAERVLKVAHRIQWVVGGSSDQAAPATAYRLLFWAGWVGASVAAESLRVRTHDGDIAFEDIDDLHGLWWEYWRAYWNRRASPDALPYDPGCETTIPLK